MVRYLKATKRATLTAHSIWIMSTNMVCLAWRVSSMWSTTSNILLSSMYKLYMQAYLQAIYGVAEKQTIIKEKE